MPEDRRIESACSLAGAGAPALLAGLLADLVLVLHAGFILFVMFGALLQLRWPRAPLVHLPMLAWGVAIELIGWTCPLTPLEKTLRHAAGEGGYTGGFIEHYLLPLIYPPGLTSGVQLVLGLGLLALNAVLYSVVWIYRRRALAVSPRRDDPAARRRRPEEDALRAHDRIRPLRPEEWSPAVRDLLGGTHERVARLEGDQAHEDGDASGTLNILRTIAHHEALLGPFLGFAGALALEGALSRRDSELLALRAAWNCRSPFEWGHHVIFARAAGLDDAQIERIALAPDHADWSDSDRLLLRAADELHAGQDLSEATWAALRAERSDAELVELPFVVGQYTMLSMVANATGVPLEAGLEPMPQPQPD